MRWTRAFVPVSQQATQTTKGAGGLGSVGGRAGGRAGMRACVRACVMLPCVHGPLQTIVPIFLSLLRNVNCVTF